MASVQFAGTGGAAICGALCLSTLPLLAQDLRVSPELSFEATLFPEDAQFPDQRDGGVGALIATGDLTWRSAERRWQAVLEPYLRYDSGDNDRSYGDLRRGFLRYLGDGWDVTIGTDRVFWGVVESVNVVDILNQRDRLENADLDEKLGQPMLRFAAQTEIGDFDLYYLPYFRERAYPGPESRPQFPLPVDDRNPGFEREGAETAGDIALRYANRFGGFDLGLTYFQGTARQPRLDLDPARQVLVPFYQRQRQAGIDLQYTTDAWLWKLEAAAVEIGADRFTAAVGGVEYTFFDVGGSGRDIGLIAEYIYDDRDQSRSPVTPFDDDIFLGTRITWNDLDDSELLAGAIIDANGGGAQFSLEYERRLFDSNLLEIELRAYDGQKDPLLQAFEEDSSLLLRWTRFF
ncbi:hypothetical protein [Dinoroseobacter sp. S76]|uniref:hypothetical protein n=1 Tax=Dinoroseobacter sp. S76 TaxID=3415124 RepID=UPI003C7CA345